MAWNTILEHTAGKIKSFYGGMSPTARKMVGRSAAGAAIGGFAAGPDRRGRGMLAGTASGIVSAGGIDHIPGSMRNYAKQGMGYAKQGLGWARNKTGW